MLRTLLLSILVLARVQAAEVAVHNESLRNEISRAVGRGTDWLSKNQNPEGWWSTTDQPAVTALALVALNPQAHLREAKFTNNFARGYAFLTKHIQPDGSIYNTEKGLANYNTSL